ncbi:hypothetical protein [Thiocystis violacea]|uniref:hypothetical protein n=1 Tax=Thiocystis violacea TaxID=13725 RepID=UPI0019062D3E|nr:hypothetical protein [Thiocystis violacea]MBK1721559.1 hypothetical protein [Thiocystis violacea]
MSLILMLILRLLLLKPLTGLQRTLQDLTQSEGDTSRLGEDAMGRDQAFGGKVGSMGSWVRWQAIRVVSSIDWTRSSPSPRQPIR